MPIPPQPSLEITELVSRLGVDIEDLELLLADRNHARDLVVVCLELAGARLDFQDVSAFAGCLGMIDQLHAPGLTFCRGIDLGGSIAAGIEAMKAAGATLVERV